MLLRGINSFAKDSLLQRTTRANDLAFPFDNYIVSNIRKTRLITTQTDYLVREWTIQGYAGSVLVRIG